MLIQPHASSDAVHDDSDPLLVHYLLLETFFQRTADCFSDSRRKLRSRASGPNQKIKIMRTITAPSNIVRAHGYPKWSRSTNSIAVAGDARSTPSWYTNPGN